MKKFGLFLLTLALLSGCSNKKEESTTSSSTTEASTSEVASTSTTTLDSLAESATNVSSSAVVNDDSTVSTENNTGDTTQATTPAEIRGTWVGEDGENLVITETTITDGNQTFEITKYQQSGDTYTLLWDVEKVKNPGNPQPFIYTYDQDADELISGIIYTRQK